MRVIADMMRPRGPFVCRADSVDRVVLLVPICVVLRRRSVSSPEAAASSLGDAIRGAPMEANMPAVNGTIRVIIADDHAVVRDGIRTVLEREAGEFEIVAEAADVPSTIREVREHKPDLLTLDLTMPGGSSLAALPSCFVAHPTLAVAILTKREYH